MNLDSWELGMLNRLKEGDETALKTVNDISYSLLTEVILIMDEDMDPTLKHTIRIASFDLLGELKLRLKWDIDCAGLATKCEALADALNRYREYRLKSKEMKE